MSVELVIEKISLVEIPEKPFELLSAAGSDLKAQFSLQDQKVLQLLTLVDKYETLTNDNLRVHFINGFLDLSRANYNGSRKFGADQLDLRAYLACSVVKYDEKFELEDRLAKQRESERDFGAGTRNSAKETSEDSKTEAETQNEKSTVSTAKSGGQLRKRNTTKKSDSETQKTAKLSHDESETAPKIASNSKLRSKARSDSLYRDPINQFGGLVPYQLRSSQKEFKLALAECVELVNLQREILQLVSEIEDLEKLEGEGKEKIEPEGEGKEEIEPEGEAEAEVELEEEGRKEEKI